VKTGSPTPMDRWIAVAGAGQTWLAAEFDSYTAWSREPSLGRTSRAPSSTAILAVFREDLSYHPERLVGGLRAFSVTVVTTHPGHATDYVAERRIVKAAHEKAQIKETYSVYQVSAGLPAGTFLLVLPYDDLGELDQVAAIHGAAYDQALGDDGRKTSR